MHIGLDLRLTRDPPSDIVFIRDNLISWKSKKQTIVARSSAEVEYKTMTSTTCELIWLKQLLKELRFEEFTQMTLICDN